MVLSQMNNLMVRHRLQWPGPSSGMTSTAASANTGRWNKGAKFLGTSDISSITMLTAQDVQDGNEFQDLSILQRWGLGIRHFKRQFFIHYESIVTEVLRTNSTVNWR